MYSHLTREQRYVIYLEIQRRTSQKAIAQLIGVSKSMVSREIRRNSTPNGKYVWVKAQDRADGRKKRKHYFDKSSLTGVVGSGTCSVIIFEKGKEPKTYNVHMSTLKEKIDITNIIIE